MAFCSNCGSQLKDGSKFCSNCGVPVAAAGGMAAVQHNEPAPVQEPVPQPAAPQQGTYEAPKQAAPQQGSYEPPKQAAPQQGSYEPPKQAAPQKGSYEPPKENAGSYVPPQQPEKGKAQKAPKQPKEKKPINKTTLVIAACAAVAVVLVIVLALVLGGKGGSKAPDDPNLGQYTAVEAELWGISTEIDELWNRGFTVELKEKGNCTLNIDGSKASGKWTLKGNVFHVEGGGIDCDGTLKDGVMTLENVLNMGIKLTFAKQGSATGSGTKVPARTEAPIATDEPDSLSAVQQQWNGTWYGVLQFTDCSGKYDDYDYLSYDVYLEVEVDEAGNGSFTLRDSEAVLASATCQASVSGGLYAVEGEAFGAEMYTHNWMFLPDRNFDNKYCMTDEITDGDGDMISLAIWVKPWGALWDEEVASDFYQYPPDYDSYKASLGSGAGGTLSTGTSGGSPSAGGSSLDTVYDYGDFGQVFFSYPGDEFYVDTEAFVYTLAAKDGSVKIMMVGQFGPEDYEYAMEGMDGYSEFKQYTSEEITVAGYKARRITYYDSWFGYNAEIYVDFGERIHNWYGFKFCISSEESMEACLSDTVMAILNSISFA